MNNKKMDKIFIKLLLIIYEIEIEYAIFNYYTIYTTNFKIFIYMNYIVLYLYCNMQKKKMYLNAFNLFL